MRRHSQIWCGLALLASGASLHVHAAPPGPAEPSAADGARRATAVATYEGGEITVGEVEDAVGTAGPNSLEDMSRLSYVQHFYFQTLREELLLGEAQRRGYADLPSVKKRVAELAMNLMLGAVIAEPIKSFVPSDDALQEFFKTRQPELGAPELRQVIELVVATEAEARELIQKFQAAQGQELRELVKQHSLGSTRNEGGQTRYFESSGLIDDKSTSVDSALAKAAFALPPVVGTTSNLFPLSGPEKRFGIVKLMAQRPAYTPSYQQAIPVMKKILTDEERDRRRGKLEADARATYQPKIHDELLKLLPAELGPAEAEAK